MVEQRFDSQRLQTQPKDGKLDSRAYQELGVGDYDGPYVSTEDGSKNDTLIDEDTSKPLTYRIGEIITQLNKFLSNDDRVLRQDEEGFPKRYYDWQIECLERIKKESHVVLSSPTNTGKTAVFLDWARQKKEKAEDNNDGSHHTIYVTSPIRALSEDHFLDLKKMGYKVGLETGEGKIIPEGADYICCTQEIYTNKYADDDNATLIVDEFHIVSENPGRARAYVDGLRNSKAENSLVCSATFGKIQKTVGYIEKITGQRYCCYENKARLTELKRRGRIGIEDIQDALVVSFSVKNCKLVADTLLEARANGIKRSYRIEDERDDEYDDEYDDDDEERRKYQDVEIEEVQPVVTSFVYDDARTQEVKKLANELNIDNEELIKWAEYGISTYYGNMLPKEKAFVKRAFTGRLIDAIAATDAVAYGLNLPVRMTVFGQLVKYNENRPISKNLFDQISGRAGRVGYFDKGEVYYCDEFYWEDRKGYHHPIEKRGYSTGELYREMYERPNESLSIKLTPDYKAILSGRRTIEEEIEFIKKYSTVDIDEWEEKRMLQSYKEAVDCREGVFRYIVNQAIRINESKRYSESDEDFYEMCSELAQRSYVVKFDSVNKKVIWGESENDGDLFWREGEVSLSNNELYREVERSVLSRFRASGLDDIARRLNLVLQECYNPQVDPYTNKEYAMSVLLKRAGDFDGRIQSAKSLRELMTIRSYLLSLPRKHRKRFVDSIFRVEQRIDALDETVLGEWSGRLSLSEVSKLLQERTAKNATIAGIEKKVVSGKDYNLTKEEVELLFANPSESDMGLTDQKTYTDTIIRLRRYVSLKALIDSGADVEKYIHLLPEWDIISHEQNAIYYEKDPKYCFQCLVDMHSIDDSVFSTFRYESKLGTEDFTKITLDNIGSLLAGGVGMKRIISHTEFYFSDPSQIDAFAPYIDNAQVIDLFRQHKIADMEVLLYASAVIGADADAIARNDGLRRDFVQSSISRLVKEAGCQPNSLVGYCVGDAEGCQELLDLGATSNKLIEYNGWEWISKNTQTLYERGMIDDAYLLGNLQKLDEEAVIDYGSLIKYYKEKKPYIAFRNLSLLYSRTLDKTIFTFMNTKELLERYGKEELRWLMEKRIVDLDFSDKSDHAYNRDKIMDFATPQNVNDILSHGYMGSRDIVEAIGDVLALSPSFKSMRNALSLGSPPCRFIFLSDALRTDALNELTRAYGRKKVEKLLSSDIKSMLNNFKNRELYDDVRGYFDNRDWDSSDTVEEVIRKVDAILRGSEYSNLSEPLEQFLQVKRKGK
ncbi:MAG: DEAD/DEAH box helicase [Candidatus Saccharibacteria bacterium]|nr:DEAD/DEAH box helicase [Candidatus Saccharibacteria bacterium]